jgi:hypothetical protein
MRSIKCLLPPSSSRLASLPRAGACLASIVTPCLRIPSKSVSHSAASPLQSFRQRRRRVRRGSCHDRAQAATPQKARRDICRPCFAPRAANIAERPCGSRALIGLMIPASD